MLFPGGGAAASAAALLAPGADPRRLTEPFLEAGAGLVVLRRGERGAVLHDGASGRAWSVPAYALEGNALVDPTGCGNACCGAFLAAMLAGDALASALAWGCAAGSLMAGWRGVPPPPALLAAGLVDEARRRQGLLLQQAVQL